MDDSEQGDKGRLSDAIGLSKIPARLDLRKFSSFELNDVLKQGFKTLGILLICLGSAILGTIFCDFLIHMHDAERRNVLAPPRKTFPFGAPAPEFVLPDAIGQGSVRLADFRYKKPVLLLFGSFG